MEDIVMSLQSLVFMNLLNDSPILSGNMQMNIQCGLSTPSEAQVVIEAPYYDMKEWRKTGNIIRTGQLKNGFSDYALAVNEVGAFGKHNKSEGWVDRTLIEAVETIANMIGAEVINKL